LFIIPPPSLGFSFAHDENFSKGASLFFLVVRVQAPVINVVVVGLFEEEEEGTGVTSNVDKVEGEDPATPGPLT